MTTPEILRQAAKEVRAGWVRGIRHDDDKNVCAVGALENAISQRRLEMQYDPSVWAEATCPGALQALAQLLPARPNDVWTITHWNNASDQTAENVAATMELAAICFEQARAIEETLDAVDPQVEVLESGLRA